MAVRARFWLAYGALAVAIALLVPALTPLSGSMDAFADDLANGSFRPFGPTGGTKITRAFTGSLGGLTGDSGGNYLPGGQDMPTKWIMDRDGRSGSVVIDYVFTPALGAMKRLKSFDRVAVDGETLEVADRQLRPLERDPSLRYDQRMTGAFAVQFEPGRPTPIFSVHPKNVVETWSTEPRIAGGVQFFRDGADTIYALANHEGIVTLNITYLTSTDYYTFQPPVAARPGDYPLALRPTVSDALKEDAEVVLARAGVEDPSDVGKVLSALTEYFRNFGEGPIPEADEVESLYLALALGGNGCCRHRAFAFMVTAQAVGIPTRVIVNEAHAFVEVAMPGGDWHQINLGGCGSYTVNNPDGRPSWFDQAEDPRGEANPDEDRPTTLVASFTNITESPDRVVKGERYLVRGIVQGPDGRGVPGAKIDVFLNETKDTPGKLTGAGVSRQDGSFEVEARVPKELAARSYQLVARATDGAIGNVRFAESWSDPPVDVFTPTRFAFPVLKAAIGFPANVSGRLLDVDGNAVAGEEVDWSLEGVAQQPVRTDARGGFVVRVNFTTTGERIVAFTYAGDNRHHGPAFGNASVQVDRGAILLPSEAARIDRGHAGTLAGDVAVAGVPLGDREVRVTLFRANTSIVAVQASGATDARGHFALRVEPPMTLRTGIYDATYEVASLGLDARTLVLVNARPALTVDAPDEISRRDGFDVVATILSDDGRPMAGAVLALHLDGNATPYRVRQADAQGEARFSVPAGVFDSGGHTIHVAFDGDGDHSPVVSAHEVSVARPWYELVPPVVWLALLGAALLAAAGSWLLRPAGFLRRKLAARQTPPVRGIVIGFPDYPDGLPAVSEPGGAARVSVGLRARDGSRRSGGVTLLWHDGRLHGRARKMADAVFELPTPQEQDIQLTARGRGLARIWTRPAHATLPVISYREAVERAYVDLRQRAALDPTATPGDLVRALASRVTGQRAQGLAQVRALFEVADYSEARIDAAFYRDFIRARQLLEEALKEEPTVAAA